MRLNTMAPGLAANAANSMLELVALNTKLEQEYLEQQKYQIKMGAEGVKGTVAYTQASVQAQSDATRAQANGMITNGAFQVGGQGIGFLKSRISTTSQINAKEAQMKQVDNALSHLNKPFDERMGQQAALSRAGNSAPVGQSQFEAKFVRQEGFSYGDTKSKIEPYDPQKPGTLGTTEAELQSPPTAAARQHAIDAANEAKSNLQKDIENLRNEQRSTEDWMRNLGAGAGALGQGIYTQQQANQLTLQAQVDAANATSRYLQESSSQSTQMTTSAFDNAKSHISQVLQNLGALAEVDNMRA